MNDYEKTIEVLQNRVRELEQQIQSVVGVKKWEPKGGNWFIYGDGGIYEGIALETERATQAQAQRASVEMRKFNRLLALRDELCGDEVVNFNNRAFNYYLYFNHADKSWDIDFNDEYEAIMPYFTTRELAQKACNMLNRGEVVL